MLRPMRTADGENHHASRRDVWPKLPSFQTTCGPAIFPPRQGIVKRAFPPLAANYNKNRLFASWQQSLMERQAQKAANHTVPCEGRTLLPHSPAGTMEFAQIVKASVGPPRGPYIRSRVPKQS